MNEMKCVCMCVCVCGGGGGGVAVCHLSKLWRLVSAWCPRDFLCQMPFWNDIFGHLGDLDIPYIPRSLRKECKLLKICGNT